MFHLKRSAFGGLIDAQPILVLALLFQGDEKWSLFVAHSLSSTVNERIDAVRKTFDSLWPTSRQNTRGVDDQRCIQWVHRQRRERQPYTSRHVRRNRRHVRQREPLGHDDRRPLQGQVDPDNALLARVAIQNRPQLCSGSLGLSGKCRQYIKNLSRRRPARNPLGSKAA